GLIDDGIKVLRGARVHTGKRSTSNKALLVGEHDLVENVLLRGDGRDAGGDACAEVAHRSWAQLHGSTPGNDLSFAEGQARHRLQGNAQLPRVAWAVGCRVRLLLISIDDDIVDEDSGNLDVSCGQSLALGKAFDLNDNSRALTAGCLRAREHLSRYRFVLHRDVTILVGRRSTQ